MKKLLLLSVSLILAAMLGMGSGATAASAGEGLFTDSSTAGDLDVSNDPTIVRSRYVNIRFDLLNPEAPQAGAWLNKGDTLVLNLFDNVTFTAVLDKLVTYSPGSHAWVGHLEGRRYSNVSLATEDGVMSGNVVFPGGFYAIRYAGNGVHAIYKMDSSAFPPEAEPIPVEAAADESIKTGPIEKADSASQIDVMVVYDSAAKTGAGGTTAMNTLINLAITETNTSYSNSGITQRVRLVYKGEVTYSETGFNWDTALARLKGTSDGYMDSVHTLRNTYKADEVVMLVADSAWCGLAYLMTSVSSSFASSAFGLVRYTCATGYYSFGHEMGHNMAARHDRYVDNTNNSPYAYNHGYVHTGSTAYNRWRTVMAYDNKCDDLGYDCTRIQYWSNPDKTYHSAATGTVNDDNHRTLNNTAYTVANFRVNGGFESLFTSNSTGWTPVYGTWGLESSNYYKTAGVASKFSSTKYNSSSYTTLRYEARMKRTGCTWCTNYLIIRGTDTPIHATYKTWYRGYRFQYSNDGKYSVWKDNSGSYTTLKTYTSSSAIVQNGWNTLKVTASGSTLKFYINGTLVWTGSDSSFSSGKVGIGMYRDTSSTGNKLQVDWAKLSSVIFADARDMITELVPVEELFGLGNGSGLP